MNITPINNAQNFKGLWGQSKKSLSGADDIFLYEKTKFYHPFKDETKEEIKIPASKAPVFKAGKALKDLVNKK